MNCLLTGVGGQGTVLASKLLATCAMNRGFFARTAETIGMAQRGGCVTSHVRFGEEVSSPLIPLGEADVVIAFEPGEAVRALPYLKKGGRMVVNQKAVKPVTDSLSEASYSGEEMLRFLKERQVDLVLVDGDGALEKLGSAKVLNLVLLGAAAPSLGFSLEDLDRAIEEKIPEKFRELNRKAVRILSGDQN